LWNQRKGILQIKLIVLLGPPKEIFCFQDLNKISNTRIYRVNPLTEYEILKNILISTKNALFHSKNFNNYYVSYFLLFYQVFDESITSRRNSYEKKNYY